jgi:hypothetical protein
MPGWDWQRHSLSQKDTGAREKPVDLMVTAVILPGIDVETLTGKMRKINPGMGHIEHCFSIAVRV